jgi:hypothetical protein
MQSRCVLWSEGQNFTLMGGLCFSALDRKPRVTLLMCPNNDAQVYLVAKIASVNTYVVDEEEIKKKKYLSGFQESGSEQFR